MEEEARKLQEAAQFKARPAVVLHKKPFEPKKSSYPLIDITAVELNTERRAKEREEFDTRIKLEQAKLEELRQLVCINNLIKQNYTVKVHLHLSAICLVSSMRYVIMDAFRHVRFRDIRFPQCQCYVHSVKFGISGDNISCLFTDTEA
jgi:hypothetical protein